MAKKRRRGKKRTSGWPRERGELSEERRSRAVERLLERFRTRSVGSEEATRYTRRLATLLHTWPGLQLVRPDLTDLQEAFTELTPDEQGALAEQRASQRRARRARAKVLARVIDDEVIEALGVELEHAAAEAETRDDQGALALAFYGLELDEQGAVRREDNVLFAMLLELALREMVALAFSVGDLTEEGEEAGQEPQPSSPMMQLEMRRALARAVRRLVRYVEDGTLRACLTAEELEPLLAELRRAGPPEGPEQPAQAALVRDPTVRLHEAFARDPAHDEAFRRFYREVEAQAEEARAADDPRARRLAEVASLFQVPEEGDRRNTHVRMLIVEASLLRLQREGQLEFDGEPGQSG
jgi:hypothetical protein